MLTVTVSRGRVWIRSHACCTLFRAGPLPMTYHSNILYRRIGVLALLPFLFGPLTAAGGAAEAGFSSDAPGLMSPGIPEVEP